MTTLPTTFRTIPGLGHAGRRPANSRLVAAVERLNGWIERYRQRRTLLELNDHLLKDIGVSRVDAEREGYKPFWRP
ncbi:MAG: DUF1127 domain-containing protein [Geminicoccaceae bacterium]